MIMDKNTKDFQLFRLRSTGAAIADGYRLYFDNFRKIFRTTWLMAIIYAIASGLLANFFTTQLPRHYIEAIISSQMQGQGEAASIVMTQYTQLIMASIGFQAVSALLAAFGFSILSEHGQTNAITAPAHWWGRVNKHILVKTLTAWLCLLVIFTLFFAIVGTIVSFGQQYLSPIAILALLGLLLLIVFLLVPLLILWTCKYILSQDNSHGFVRIPLRSWGAAIVVALVVSILTSLLTFITELPAIVLFFANIISQTGTLLGDPTGMPDYMSWMNIVVFTLAGFILAYVQLSSLFPFYYLYGSFEAEEKERERLGNPISNKQNPISNKK